MYPRIVRQIAPIGETALSSAVEASGCCQSIWEFIWWKIRPAARVEAAPGADLRPPYGDVVRAHVGLQRLRNAHAAVGLLIVLQDRNPCAPYRQGAAVQRVQEFSLAPSLGTIADIRPPCLKSFKVRARRNLAEQILTGQPDFNVISLGRGESYIGRA